MKVCLNQHRLTIAVGKIFQFPNTKISLNIAHSEEALKRHRDNPELLNTLAHNSFISIIQHNIGREGMKWFKFVV